MLTIETMDAIEQVKGSLSRITENDNYDIEAEALMTGVDHILEVVREKILSGMVEDECKIVEVNAIFSDKTQRTRLYISAETGEGDDEDDDEVDALKEQEPTGAATGETDEDKITPGVMEYEGFLSSFCRHAALDKEEARSRIDSIRESLGMSTQEFTDSANKLWASLRESVFAKENGCEMCESWPTCPIYAFRKFRCIYHREKQEQ